MNLNISIISSYSKDDVDARIGFHDSAHCSNLETEGPLFEVSLHLPNSEITKVTSSVSRTALTMLLGKCLEIFNAFYLGDDILNISYSLLCCSRHCLASTTNFWIS